MTLRGPRGACIAGALVLGLAVAPAAPVWGAPAAEMPAATTLPAPVLPVLTPASGAVNDATIAARMRAVKTDRLPDIGAVVLDGTGRVVYQSKNTPKVPASTMKVLTSLVALDVLGPDSRFETKVVQGASPSQIVLVGGGDPLMTSTAAQRPGGSSMEALAARTAAALAQQKVTSVTLQLDATLFGGPAWEADWPDRFKWSVAPITALKVDHALATPGSLNRDVSPNAHAGRVFAAQLAARGIKVTATAYGKAPADAPKLAGVSSLPVAAIVEETLAQSDNDAAETLAWQLALKRGQPANFDTSRDVLTAELKARGLFDEGMVIDDGNGISPKNRVTPGALARAIRQGIETPTLRNLLTGLPVAGATGTLAGRFAAPTAAAARGKVRAKTGSITGVDSLAGYVVSNDGHVFSYAFVLNGTPTPAKGRAWIDDASAVLAACGCS